MWRPPMVSRAPEDDDESEWAADSEEYGDEEAARAAPAPARERERAAARVQPRDASEVRPLHADPRHGDPLHEAVQPPSMPRRDPGLVRPVPREEPSALVTTRPPAAPHESSSPVHVVEPDGFHYAH